MTSFRLEFDQGGQIQHAAFQKSSITIGRDRSSDFVLDHPTVSRQHALIVDEGGGHFKLVVLSRGGLTAVNGQPVQVAEVQLYDGVELTFGQYTVRFRSSQAPSRPSGPSSPMGGSQMKGQASSMGGGESSLGGGSSGASGPGGGPSEPPVPEALEDPSPANDAGIMSWDEIAASSESEEEDKSDEEERGVSDLQRMRRANQSSKNESNPVLIIGALLAAGALLFVALSSGSDDSAEIDQSELECGQEESRLEVSVSCIDETSCKREAEHNYERGVDLIRSQAVERGNLFEGYQRLLKSRAYLEEAGINEIPAEFDQWHEKHDEALAELDKRYREFMVRFHQAEQRGRNREMAEVVERVQSYFPEHMSCENQWARNAERSMKSQGIYPR